MTESTVTVWTREATREELGERLGGLKPTGASWRKEVFTDVGWEDWVRTWVGFYIGSGPDHADMVLASTVASEPSRDGSIAMDDTQTQIGLGNPQERELGADPVYLGAQLSAVAKGAQRLIIVME